MRRGHAANNVKIFGANTLFLGIEQFLTQVNALYQTNDDTIVPNVQCSPLLAFEAGRRFGDAWRLDCGRCASRQSGVDEFVFAVGQRGSAFVHRFGDGFIDQIDHKFMRQANIPSGVLRRAIVAVARANS